MPPAKPALWGERPKRRRTLSREVIVDTALHLVDAEGLDALSMRRVAQELGTGAASLYAHVDNKDELLMLVLDQVNGALERPEPDPARWREQVKEFLRQARDNLAGHNDLARAMMDQNIPLGPSALDATETTLALLLAGGMPRQVAAYAGDLLALYVVSSAYELSRRQAQGATDPAQAEAYLTGIREFFAGLPADRYPVVSTFGPELTRNEGDDRFDFGVDVLLAGLEAQGDRWG